MRDCCVAFVLASIAFVLAVSTAHAQPQPPRDRSDVEAQARFESGRLAFESGRYEEALADFRRSYELSQRPLILYNIGIVLDRLRRDAEALDAFERYLEAVPDAENRADVEARIAILRTQVAAPPPVQEAAPIPPPPSPRPQEGYEIWAWISAGVGIAAAIAAPITWSAADDAYDDLDRRCGELGCSGAQIDASSAPELVDATNAMIVTAIIAGVSTAVAWTLYFVDLRLPSGTAMRIGPGSLRLAF
ncbi:tetratricopeptide repeat protein [Sandaracinus amylolyticus]|uniref:Tetratricopeptide repeat protein n=1 Tax=Sandaracinus amylolyticus TaxID=927083 RepID=A0A0F6YI02_9BACT|nr:tetratricopeptide repeat protein [Sandaracinus amylolyticus]AKF04551.1 hypothetical protein DB32_001700 [Sandaracinus amylolyticus]